MGFVNGGQLSSLTIATVIFEKKICNCAQFLNARHCDKQQNTDRIVASSDARY